jgi:hypothetical protein
VVCLVWRLCGRDLTPSSTPSSISGLGLLQQMMAVYGGNRSSGVQGLVLYLSDFLHSDDIFNE